MGVLSVGQIKRRMATYARRRGVPSLAKKYGPKIKRAARTRLRGISQNILTRTLKKRKIGSQPGAGGTQSKFYHANAGSPYLKQLFKATQENNYVRNYSAKVSADVGKQAVWEGLNLWSGGAVSDDLSYSDIPRILKNINGGTTRQNLTQKIWLKSAHARMMIANTNAGSVSLTIYDIICKDDNNQFPINSWNTGLNDASGNTTASQQLTENVGVTPFASQNFTTHYKVLQTTNIILGQGQSHEHIVTYKLNKLFKTAKLVDAEYGLRGVTLHSIVVAHGLPVDGATDETLVSTGSVDLALVYMKELKYSWISDRDQNYYYTSGLSTLSGAEQVFNIGTGTVTTVTEA